MSNNTPNINLVKPTLNEYFNLDIQNGNMDIIDKEIAAQKATLSYQTPTIVGSQIQIIKYSNVNRLYFKLDTNLTGNITISLDGGATEKPLKDIEGIQLTELEKGFVEVVADASFFTLRSGSGLSSADKQSLIDIVNSGLLNESDLKTSIINALNTKVNSVLPTGALWTDILNSINNISLGRKWASGSSSFVYGLNSVMNLSFKPTFVIIYTNNANQNNEQIVLFSNTFVSNIGGINLVGYHSSKHPSYLASYSYINTSQVPSEYSMLVNGFRIKIKLGDMNYKWIAIE